MSLLLAELCDLLGNSGATVTFSANCCSGLVPRFATRCECWRCREGRGETPDEALALNVSESAKLLSEQASFRDIRARRGEMM